MRRYPAAFVAALLLAGLGFAAHAALAKSTTVPSASAQIVMVEGRVTAESGSNLTIVTPAEGMYCKPTLMCADFLRAPVRYLVEASGARVFGNYLGGLSLGDVVRGSTIVVDGAPLRAPSGAIQGAIAASGIFLVAGPPISGGPPHLP